MKTIKDIDLNEKKVLIRCDFNVPIKDGKIVDDTRIEGALPTIKYAIEHNAKVILLSHLGYKLDKKVAQEILEAFKEFEIEELNNGKEV